MQFSFLILVTRTGSGAPCGFLEVAATCLENPLACFGKSPRRLSASSQSVSGSPYNLYLRGPSRVFPWVSAACFGVTATRFWTAFQGDTSNLRSNSDWFSGLRGAVSGVRATSIIWEENWVFAEGSRVPKRVCPVAFKYLLKKKMFAEEGGMKGSELYGA